MIYFVIYCKNKMYFKDTLSFIIISLPFAHKKKDGRVLVRESEREREGEKGKEKTIPQIRIISGFDSPLIRG